MSMDETHSHASYVADVIMRADLGQKVRVNRLGSSILVHHHTQEVDGHWLATIKIDAAHPPFDIREPDLVFVPSTADRYKMQSDREAPPRATEAAEVIHGRLVEMRDRGLFMTASEVSDLVKTFTDLLASMREDGYEDASGNVSKATEMLARHNPALAKDLEQVSKFAP